MQLETASSMAMLSNHWSVILHLTYDSSLVRPGFAQWVEDPESCNYRPDGIVMLFTFLRKVARLSGKQFHRMLWICREERGKGGRYHQHVLLSTWINPGAIARLWKWGRCEIVRFDPKGDIADYISKNLGVEIERARFSRDGNDLAVTWSNAAKDLFSYLIRYSIAVNHVSVEVPA